MNKKHCNIVFDLLPGYIENDVTDDTKEFVDEHLKECKNCQETLKNMKNNSIDEQMKIQDDSKIEIEKIKKVKRKFKTHKIILSISSIVILIIAIVLLCNTIYNAFNKTLYDKIKEVYEENSKLGNYYLTIMTKTTSREKNPFSGEYTTFEFVTDTYVKDEQYIRYSYWTENEEDLSLKNNPKDIEYGKMDESNSTRINTVYKKIYKDWMRHSLENFGYYSRLIEFENIDYKNSEIKTFEGRDWYVYKEGDEINYCEYWIDKDTLTDMRLIKADIQHIEKTEVILKKDIVTDEDIKFNYDTTGFEYTEFPN